MEPQRSTCAETGLNYLATPGPGQPVLLLHGWSAFKELWWQALDLLGPDFCCYAPDMPGHSGMLLGTHPSMPALAEEVLAFCRARGLERFALVGHSMGGNIAVNLALAHPELVERLVLVDPALHGRRLPWYVQVYTLHTHGYAALRLSRLASRAVYPLGMAVPDQHGGGMLRPALRRMAYTANHDTAALHSLLSQLLASPLDSEVGRLAVPTLVLSGANDPLVPARLSRQIAERIPGARFECIPGAAHNPMDEQPVAFASLLRAFLSPAR